MKTATVPGFAGEMRDASRGEPQPIDADEAVSTRDGRPPDRLAFSDMLVD